MSAILARAREPCIRMLNAICQPPHLPVALALSVSRPPNCVMIYSNSVTRQICSQCHSHMHTFPTDSITFLLYNIWNQNSVHKSLHTQDLDDHFHKISATLVIPTMIMVTVTVKLFECPKNKRPLGLPLDIWLSRLHLELPCMQNALAHNTPPRGGVVAGSLMRFLNIPGRPTLRRQPRNAVRPPRKAPGSPPASS